ncbi:MAG: nucleotidyltransferase domain-containing protein [Candidatus Desantisbacteria bacterium]
MKEKDNEAIKEFIEKVKNKLKSNLITLRLFGSRVRGEDRLYSDIDILVEVERLDEKVWDEVMDIAFDVNLKWEIYISPRIVEKAKFRSQRWSATGFVQAIQREGVLL